MDYMISSDADSSVRTQLRQHGNFQLVCEALTQAAQDRRTQDNVNIIIADLGLFASVIPPTDFRVTFDAVGALNNVNDTLKELVILPEVFSKGQLTKHCKHLVDELLFQI